ncbi:hypothetical protein V1J52_11335 [Streptomyces sp. TRM 70351]|uniref:hypothetical protein n=1 Tax=Streptomyces sp. TRM 70351 TaxID=3116552 RepID=UPI002E7C288C|nr:hypothetical protein [Streptomyces sp. TRM 70351]MEE1928780.1 hypothetical protein [Streptomyces sp. TRM 70351]
MRRRYTAMAVAFITACVAAFATATTSTAAAAVEQDDLALVVCVGTADQNYSPPLTTTNRTTHITSTHDYPSCSDVQLDPQYPTVTSASTALDYTTEANCLVAPPVTHPTLDLLWSNGQHSYAAVTTVVTRSTGSTIVTSIGTIGSGLFAGHIVHEVVVYPSLDVLGCLTTGVTNVSGITTLEVV